jgi:hypothetical protein
MAPPLPAIIFGHAGKKHRQWSGPKPAFKAQCVCGDRNNGWMSNLEAANQPLIGSLMQDIAMPLDLTQQETIARWAVKTAMVMEWVTRQRREFFYTRTECAELRISSQLPRNTFVWLGRNTGRYSFTSFATDVWDGEPVAAGTTHGYVNTFIVGRLAIQVLTFRIPAEYRDRPVNIHPSGKPWERFLLTIWPIQSTVSWPPELAFGENETLGLDALRQRWYE